MTTGLSQPLPAPDGTQVDGVSSIDLRESLGRAADNVAEAMETGRAIGALARQLRVLASNTNIEASRLSQAAALTEIAHRMRLLSDQAAELNTLLLNTLQVQAHTLDELRGTLTMELGNPTPDHPSVEHSGEGM